eukprot:GDKK01033701.1.p1 GENE.GDKK01033701.1~~GDKK01033701.1.p1  ORF type:complete len:125 (+),score=5.25 GDKK01033701.1:25-399(+)
MVHEVTLFIDGIHFGLAIKCADGWYKFEFAAGGARGFQSSGSYISSTTNQVTIRQTAPSGKIVPIGGTNKGLKDIIDFARLGSNFHGSEYSLNTHNCRHFSTAMASFMGVKAKYESAVAGYHFY